MVNLEESAFAVFEAFDLAENVAHISASPAGGSAFKVEQRRVHADHRAPLVHFVGVAGTHARYERNPRREFPLHLDVEIRRVFQFPQELRNSAEGVFMSLRVS